MTHTQMLARRALMDTHTIKMAVVMPQLPLLIMAMVMPQKAHFTWMEMEAHIMEGKMIYHWNKSHMYVVIPDEWKMQCSKDG